MAKEVYDEYGQRFVQNDDGEWVVTPEHDVLTFAGKQLADMYDNARLFLTDDEQAKGEIRAELADREQLFSGAEATSPIQSFIGGALPGMATAPISAGGVLGGLALNSALGAAESALSYDENLSAGERALIGATGGVVGDWAGRILGRVFNAGRGLADDIASGRRALSGAMEDPDIAAVAEFEALGGKTAAFQRMAPGSKAQRLAERAAQMNEASFNPDPYLKEITDSNDALYRQAASEAVGNPTTGRLDEVWQRQTIDMHNQMFEQLARQAERRGEITVSGALKSTMDQNPAIQKLKTRFGLFKGLDRKGKPFITSKEFMEARQAIAAEAANEENSAIAWRTWKLVDELDDLITSKPGMRDFADAHASVREGSRNFMLLERPNVIDNRGEINVQALRRNLESKASGYGRKATAMGDLKGQKPTNPATQRMIRLAQLGDRVGFKAFKSSGTAENLIGSMQAMQAADAATSALQGNLAPALNMALQSNAPRFSGLANRGNGALFEGLYAPTATPVLGASQAVGRSMLDQSLFPFIGSEDDRRP